MDLNKLLEIEEYAAYGFYEAQDKPYPFAYAHAYRRLYELQPARVLDEYLLVPAEPFYNSVTCYGNAQGGGINSHLRGEAFREETSCNAGSTIYCPHHCDGMIVRNDILEKKLEQYPQHTSFIQDLAIDLRTKGTSRSGYIHNNPDTITVVQKGFSFLMQELAEETQTAEAENDTEGLHFLYAMDDYAQGVVAYYNKHLHALEEAVIKATGERKRKLSIILEGYRHCFMEPSTTFVSAMLAVNLCWMLDACDSIGRLDYVLGDLLEKDLASGKVDLELVREMLDNFWDFFERYNGWNLQIGGATPEGKDCYNTLTRECLLCNTRHKTRRPNLALRVTKNMPQDIWELALDSIMHGNGKPTLYHDELYIESLRKYLPEIAEEDLSMYALGGCTETMIMGKSSVDSLAADENLCYCLMAALFNGKNIQTGKDWGVAAGEFTDCETFEDFIANVKIQIDYLLARMGKRLYENSPCGGSRETKKELGDPRIVRSMFTQGCIRNRKSFDMGGATYNWATASFQGTTVLTDSLAAIKKCVFQDKTISKETLLEALKNDFKGYEDVQRLLMSVDKFGNDIDWVDAIAKDLIGYTWDECLKIKYARGGIMAPSVILFTTYESAGKSVCAMPNGRNAGKPLNDSVGAFEGAAQNGPTALINSVLKLPLHTAFGTPVFNLRFNKQVFGSETGRKNIIMLLKSYFQKGGMQAQISVLSAEEMKAAQKDPEKYKDLIVRIGGYSEYFVYLSEELQETVIKRAEFCA